MIFRGLELGLRGRDPRDAWLLAQRICGTCTGVHALASVRAVENALGIKIPVNARLIRNLLAGTLLVRDHVMDFYLSQLPDWVDVKAATTADPAATATLAASRAQRQGETAADFAQGARPHDGRAQQRRTRASSATAGGATPPTACRPSRTCCSSRTCSRRIDWQREFMRIHTLLGGKDPHPQTYLVGGMAVAPPWGGPSGATGRDHPQVPDHNAPQALSADGFAFMGDLLAKARDFVDPGLRAGHRPAGRAPTRTGSGWAQDRADTCRPGEYPQDDQEQPSMLFPTGRLDERQPRAVAARRPDTEFLETVATSWYTYAVSDGRPARRRTAARRRQRGPAWPCRSGASRSRSGTRGSRRPATAASRWRVGPLARVLVGVANGRAEIAQSLATQMAPLNLALERLPGAAGRLLARAVEADVVVRQTATWLADLRTNLATGDVAVADITYWDPGSWPGEAQGFSLGEGPRGTVAHWVTHPRQGRRRTTR